MRNNRRKEGVSNSIFKVNRKQKQSQLNKNATYKRVNAFLSQ